jgi:hypothetical protein
MTRARRLQPPSPRSRPRLGPATTPPRARGSATKVRPIDAVVSRFLTCWGRGSIGTRRGRPACTSARVRWAIHRHASLPGRCTSTRMGYRRTTAEQLLSTRARAAWRGLRVATTSASCTSTVAECRPTDPRPRICMTRRARPASGRRATWPVKCGKPPMLRTPPQIVERPADAVYSTSKGTTVTSPRRSIAERKGSRTWDAVPTTTANRSSVEMRVLTASVAEAAVTARTFETQSVK